MAQPLKVLPRCDACTEREQCIFGNLPPPQLEIFNRIRHFHQYKARQIIYHEGTPALGFHIGCTGRIKLSKADSNGREQIVRIANPGEIIGEEALLDSQPYGATAEPLEDCHTAFIKRAEFVAFLNGGGGIASRFLLHFCRTLIETQGRLARMGLGDARARLAGTLLDLTQRYGKPARGGVNLDLELSRSELDSIMIESKGGHGTLKHLAPVLSLSESRPYWDKPSPVLGSSRPEWL